MTWQKEFSSSIKSYRELNSFFESNIIDNGYPVFIPLHLAHEIKKLGPQSALWKQFMPADDELLFNGLKDPIGDEVHLKAPQLIHRYKNRALFMPTTICPVNCRYCFRKNELYETNEIFQRDFDQTLSYLMNHPEIEEIIFTGGDPLILSDEILRKYLTSFSTIDSIKFFRFHSRTPVILPSRITDEFLNLLNEFNVKLVIHINHKEEITKEVKAALEKFKPYSPLSQSVLLKNVNDDPDKLEELIRELINFNIRPYYLHHPDQVAGGMHFYMALEEGRKIYGQLRNRLPGWAIPQYVIDIPGGEGKVNAFNPETYSFTGTLINRFGDKLRLPQGDSRAAVNENIDRNNEMQ